MNDDVGQGIVALSSAAERQKFWNLPDRRVAMGLAAIAAVVFVVLMSAILSGRPAELLLDKPSAHFIYPFTIQNAMHVVFFLGLAELFVRWRVALGSGTHGRRN
jgi:hypothetical protein